MYEQIRRFILDDIEFNGRRKKFIANRLGYATSGLYAFLNGHAEPSKRMLECMADFYNMALIYQDGEYKLIGKENIRSAGNGQEVSEDLQSDKQRA